MPRVTNVTKKMTKEERAAAREASSKARGEARTKAQEAKKASAKPAPDKYSEAAKRSSEKRAAARAATDAQPAPRRGDKYSESAKRMSEKRAEARANVDKQHAPRRSPPSAPKNTQPYYDPSKATAKATKGAVLKQGLKTLGKKALVASPYGAAAVTGFEVGKAIAGPGNRSGVDAGGGQMKRNRKPTMADQAKEMAKASFEANKGRKKAAIAAGVSPSVLPSGKGKAASAPTAKSERPAQQKAAPKGGKSHSSTTTDMKKQEGFYSDKPAPVVDKTKKMKRNAGFDNYEDIMSSQGLAGGGPVWDTSLPGVVKNVMRAGASLKKKMEGANAPKAASSNQQPVERKRVRKDGNSGRELVPEDIMGEIKPSRGYANGGKVGHSDIYGSYDGSGGMAEHMVKMEKTNLKRNK